MIGVWASMRLVPLLGPLSTGCWDAVRLLTRKLCFAGSPKMRAYLFLVAASALLAAAPACAQQPPGDAAQQPSQAALLLAFQGSFSNGPEVLGWQGDQPCNTEKPWPGVYCNDAGDVESM